jgi:hypothetical protein
MVVRTDTTAPARFATSVSARSHGFGLVSLETGELLEGSVS